MKNILAFSLVFYLFLPITNPAKAQWYVGGGLTQAESDQGLGFDRPPITETDDSTEIAWKLVRQKSPKPFQFDQNKPNESERKQLTNKKSSMTGDRGSSQQKSLTQLNFEEEFFNGIGHFQPLKLHSLGSAIRPKESINSKYCLEET